MAERLLVRATKMVFYGGMRIREGRTFTLTDPAHFSEASMARVPEGTADDTAVAVDASPKQRVLGGAALKQKRPGVSAATGTLEKDAGI